MDKITTFFRYALLLAIFGMGTIAFIVLIGEEDTDSHLTFGEFFFIKSGAMGILYFLYRAVKYLCEKGLLPDRFIQAMSDMADEEI